MSKIKRDILSKTFYKIFKKEYSVFLSDEIIAIYIFKLTNLLNSYVSYTEREIINLYIKENKVKFFIINKKGEEVENKIYFLDAIDYFNEEKNWNKIKNNNLVISDEKIATFNETLKTINNMRNKLVHNFFIYHESNEENDVKKILKIFLDYISISEIENNLSKMGFSKDEGYENQFQKFEEEIETKLIKSIEKMLKNKITKDYSNANMEEEMIVIKKLLKAK